MKCQIAINIFHNTKLQIENVTLSLADYSLFDGRWHSINIEHNMLEVSLILDRETMATHTLNSLTKQEQHNSRVSRNFFIKVKKCIWNYFFKVSTFIQGLTKRMKKSNTLVWHKNKVKLLFFAHQLSGNIHPFTLITLTKPWCLLFWTKISMQKIFRNAQK